MNMKKLDDETEEFQRKWAFFCRSRFLFRSCFLSCDDVSCFDRISCPDRVFCFDRAYFHLSRLLGRSVSFVSLSSFVLSFAESRTACLFRDHRSKDIGWRCWRCGLARQSLTRGRNILVSSLTGGTAVKVRMDILVLVWVTPWRLFVGTAVKVRMHILVLIWVMPWRQFRDKQPSREVWLNVLFLEWVIPWWCGVPWRDKPSRSDLLYWV